MLWCLVELYCRGVFAMMFYLRAFIGVCFWIRR